jgi:phosphinothricin acetyltransferase
MNITFRELTASDFPSIKEIYDWYIENSTATFHTEPIQLKELQEFIFINHPLYKSFLIFSGQEIAGYCYFTYYKKRQAYDRTAEVTLYLKREFHHKGIGRAALDYMEAIAKEIGLKNLLGIITGENHGSIALFEKSGYTKCAHFKNVGEKFDRILDVVAYQKELQ